ncbi:hypothetical protein SCAR479_13909 [Seiridium cardinale]|uniref:Uncharacterized protein n=1 Tax=Seiridium cardinale TaxID=138064 RepID=A0ABR2X6L3_9PEZI
MFKITDAGGRAKLQQLIKNATEAWKRKSVETAELPSWSKELRSALRQAMLRPHPSSKYPLPEIGYKRCRRSASDTCRAPDDYDGRASIRAKH